MSSKSSVSLSSIVVASEDQASSGLGEEAVILDFNKSMYFGLDPVGTFIWQQLQEPVRVTAVRDAVVERYGVEVERSERDVLDFLNDLASEGLISVREEG